MALLKFNVAALKDFDGGRLAAAIEQELERAAKDCIDRPGEKKARKVELTFNLKPVDVDKTGVAESVSFRFTIRLKTPVRESIDYSMALKQNGTMAFSEHSPRNHRQGTFDALDDADQTKEGNDD
jgi:hypothetical protein